MASELHRLLEQIRTFFNNEFHINLSDLQKPTYVFVRDFYARALIEFEVDTDNLRLTQAAHLSEGMDNSLEISGDLNLVAAINRAFRFLKFGLFDLLNPGENAKRTVSMISAVMEFLSMADDLTAGLDFDSYKDKREEVIHKAAQVDSMRRKLSELALAKDEYVQATIAVRNEFAKTKMKEQEICLEVDVIVKEANAAKAKLDETHEVIRAKKAEVDRLKNQINLLKDELVDVKSFDHKEAEWNQVEQEKSELNEKYLRLVATKKKFSSAFEAVESFTEAAREGFEAIDKIEEAILAIQKEAAEMKQSQVIKKKEFKIAEEEVCELQKKLDHWKSADTKIKEDFTKKILIVTKKSSELVESIRSTSEDVAALEKSLCSLEEESEEMKAQYINYVESINKLIQSLRRG